jgi:hypothetical protein
VTAAAILLGTRHLAHPADRDGSAYRPTRTTGRCKNWRDVIGPDFAIIDKFEGADADGNDALTRAEFAATAPKPRPKKANCACA